MKKTGVKHWLIIYVILSVTFLTSEALAIVLMPHLPIEYSDILLALPNSFSVIYCTLLLGVLDGLWSLILLALVFIFMWAASVAGVVFSAKSPKPWHIPAVVFLSIDTILKFLMLVEVAFPNWQFSIFLITALLLDGLLFFLIWKIRKYAIVNELEQIPQKYADTDFREI